MDFGWVVQGATLLASAAAFGLNLRTSRWQRRASDDKLRLDLYDKRWAVCRATLSLYHSLDGDREWFTSEAFKSVHRTFIAAAKESRFLFDRESGISECLDGLALEAFKIKVHRERGGGPDALFEQRVLEDAIAAFAAFDKAFPSLEAAMAPYLNFHALH